MTKPATKKFGPEGIGSDAYVDGGEEFVGVLSARDSVRGDGYELVNGRDRRIGGCGKYGDGRDRSAEGGRTTPRRGTRRRLAGSREEKRKRRRKGKAESQGEAGRSEVRTMRTSWLENGVVEYPQKILIR